MSVHARCMDDMQITVCYSPNAEVPVVTCLLTLPSGVSVQEAIQASHLAEVYPEVLTAPTGIFARLVERTEILQEGDRVEIYRSLVCDPKQARRKRAHT